MHQVSHRHWIQIKLGCPLPPPAYLLIRLTKGETKAQIVACIHAPFSAPFCRRRFVSFGVALPICGRIRARAAPGWDPCMWEGWAQNWVGLKLDLKYLFKKESHSWHNDFFMWPYLAKRQSLSLWVLSVHATVAIYIWFQNWIARGKKHVYLRNPYKSEESNMSSCSACWP